MFIFRLRRHLIPSPLVITLLWGGVSFVAITLLCYALMLALGSPIESPFTVIALIAFSPLTLLVAILALFVEKQNGSRALLWAFAAVLEIIIGIFYISSPVFITSISSQFFTLLFCCAPFIVPTLLLSIIFGAKAWPDFQISLYNDRVLRTREILLVRSEITFEELAVNLGIPTSAIPNFLNPLCEKGYLTALVTPETGRVYTIAALIEKKRLMRTAVQARGQVRFTDLSSELSVPVELIQQWAHGLANDPAFSGFIDWRTQTLNSVEAERLSQHPSCPACGGSLTIAGQGIIRCPYCATEIFLPTQPSESTLEIQNNPATQDIAQISFQFKDILSQSLTKDSLWDLVKPKFFSKSLVYLSAAILMIGILCFTALLFSVDTPQRLSLALFMFGGMDLSLISAILLFSALRERTNPSRFFLWLITLLVAAAAFFTLAFSMGLDPSAGPGLSISSLVVYAGPAISLISLPVVFFGVKSWSEISALLNFNLEKRAANIINKYGELSFLQLSRLVGVNLESVGGLLDQLVRAGLYKGEVYFPFQRIYSLPALLEKQASLLILVANFGQITFADLSQRLNAPFVIIRDWIYQLVQVKKFHGYINWPEEKLYSSTASQLGEQTRCPACGGELNLESGNIIRCQYCRSEIFH